ncbi:uncharacterized protein BX663DRAFT_519613 [Cokeromyces recurvatus]|uniref:uncharacterized protein n=1 Tax=Cokeromyces recurvatus TaxID=90255 RepID=UPI002220D08E|nr:uncharacterized protein BX663DRAFT_519613 [Cokeromyces recurvatus]KAI7899818.1 hypothetical protein BX663DRAFT_519613 [Cokeromyces recurvatus]
MSIEQFNNNESDKSLKDKNDFKVEIDNAYLQQQNEHLNKELSFARYTINALKGIVNQRDTALNEARQELENALKHIQFLTYTLRQQRYSNGSLSGIGLVNDTDLSDDQELSEEDELDEQQQQRRPMDIMSKLPIRQPPMVNPIFTSEYPLVNDNNSILDY